MPVLVAISTMMLFSPTMVISAVAVFVVVVAPMPPPPPIAIAIAVVLVIIIAMAAIPVLPMWIPPVLVVVRVSPSLVAMCALCQDRSHRGLEQ